MEPSTFIAVYMPIYFILFIQVPAQRRRMIRIHKSMQKRRKEGSDWMENELIKKCIGKVCNISLGTMGSNFNKVKVINVVDNWIEVEKSGKMDFINAEYVQSIKVLDERY